MKEENELIVVGSIERQVFPYYKDSFTVGYVLEDNQGHMVEKTAAYVEKLINGGSISNVCIKVDSNNKKYIRLLSGRRVPVYKKIR